MQEVISLLSGLAKEAEEEAMAVGGTDSRGVATLGCGGTLGPPVKQDTQAAGVVIAAPRRGAASALSHSAHLGASSSSSPPSALIHALVLLRELVHSAGPQALSAAQIPPLPSPEVHTGSVQTGSVHTAPTSEPTSHAILRLMCRLHASFVPPLPPREDGSESGGGGGSVWGGGVTLLIELMGGLTARTLAAMSHPVRDDRQRAQVSRSTPSVRLGLRDSRHH